MAHLLLEVASRYMSVGEPDYSYLAPDLGSLVGQDLVSDHDPILFRQ